ncbi:MAG TPA: PfkB family carbohydrate kinase [Chitinophagaceae bacterium]|jgi:rfaE bifunctional protein kinase chain/domain|nr:PfkB family carbohydrate kinase [Chitinophagaceae bacterium]
MEDFKKLFSNFSSLKVGVIGDVMLDSYIWGHVDRISPEAPVPIILLEKKEERIGGAGNVALNCRSLGAAVSILSVSGHDKNAEELIALFHQNNIDTTYLIKSKSRVTTNKIRIISRNQQMMRLDDEMISDLSMSDEELFLQSVSAYIEKETPHVMILEDYNKGVLSERVIAEIIRLCKLKGIVTAVDPKRKHFFSYKGVDIFKPNLKEIKEALNFIGEEISLSVLQQFHKAMQAQLQHRISFITLSEKGVFYQQDNHASIFGSHLRSIADVSGAGDTVIAVAAMVYAATKNVKLMAAIANIAGGLVCEEVGTVAINAETLQKECELLIV